MSVLLDNAAIHKTKMVMNWMRDNRVEAIFNVPYAMFTFLIS